MLEVDYETLVADLEGESRRLIDFLGLAWDDACLSFHTTERVVHTASLWQVRQPVYASSVGRWRHYRDHIQPLLDGLIGLVPPDDADVSTARILAAAHSHQAAGRTEAAEAAYRLIIESAPDHPDALYGLGQLARGRGEFAQAIDLLRHALALCPNNADWLVELSRTCRSAADWAGSEAAAAEAAALDPDNPAAQFLLGSAWLERHEPVRAREALARARELAPNSRDAQLYFAMACMRLSDYAAAATALEDAVRRNPDDVECLTKLGWVLRERGKPHNALPHLRHAADLAPEDSRVHLALVVTLWQAHDVMATRAACEAALRIAPELADLWLHLGHCQAALGRFTEAADSYRRALACDPALDFARFALANISCAAAGQLDTGYLQALLQDPVKEARDRAMGGYALARQFDAAGDFDAAFAALAEANRLVQGQNETAGGGFDRSGFDSQIEAILESFTPSSFRAAAGLGAASECPVFVVGMPRSGTTLVEQILSSHPSVFGAGELDDLSAIAARLGAGSFRRPPSAWDPDAIAAQATAHLRKLHELGGPAMRIIDKMPDNFLFLGHIAVLYPHARIILCRRDLRDVGLSCYFQHFGDRLPWTTDLAAIAARARGFERLAAHWHAVLPLKLLEVQYETLVQNLERESRRLVDFLGLAWDPSCLAFQETERTVLTASQWQVRQPVYTTSVGRWRHYRKHLGPLLDGLSGFVPRDDLPETRGSPTEPLLMDDLLQAGRVQSLGPVAGG